jgi:hypothetical protein
MNSIVTVMVMIAVGLSIGASWIIVELYRRKGVKKDGN